MIGWWWFSIENHLGDNGNNNNSDHYNGKHNFNMRGKKIVTIVAMKKKSRKLDFTAKLNKHSNNNNNSSGNIGNNIHFIYGHIFMVR